jgi:copper chaperone CopZ
MPKVSIGIQQEFCADCALALRRFIGGMDGVEAIEVGRGSIEIDFDDSKISEETVRRLSRDNVEKLGYKLTNDE